MQSKQVDFLVAILSDSDGDGDYTNLVLSQPKLEGVIPRRRGNASVSIPGACIVQIAPTPKAKRRARDNRKTWKTLVIGL